MVIKIRNSEQTFNNVEVTIPVWRSIVQLSGDNLPTEPKDFDVIDTINGRERVVDYFVGFSVVYDKGENYIQFTNDTNTYYNYLITDENGYVIRAEISTEELDEFLYQSGQGKQYKEFATDLYDENDFPLYKIEDGELVETTDEERGYNAEKVLNQRLIEAIESKITELSNICQQVIYKGADVTLTNGTKHYSFTLIDQTNIGSLFTSAVLTKTDGIPYHADNDICELYSYMDIVRLNKAMQEYILYNTTYFNMLKAMVSKLTSIDEINAVEYGMTLSDEYVEAMNEILTQSQLMFANTLTVYGISLEELADL